MIILNLISVLCIIQNSNTIPYKANEETHVRRYSTNGIESNYKEHNENPFEELTNEDPLATSSESRRLFDWIKHIFNKNASSTTTQRTPTYQEVLNEREAFRRIEKNLTDTLTNLSHVLTQILNIVKYTRYRHFDDIHKFLPTKRGPKTLRIGYRLKRDSNGTKPTVKDITDVKTERSIAKKDLDKPNYVAYIEKRSNDLNRQEIISDISTKNANENKSTTDLNNPHVITKVSVDRNKQDVVKDNPHVNTKVSVDRNKQDVVKDSNKNATVKKELDKLNASENRTKRNTLNDLANNLEHLNSHETRIKRDTTGVNKGASKSNVTKKIEVGEDNTNPVDKDGKTEEEVITNGRRSDVLIKPANDEVKNRLFKYVDEAFLEITKKVDSLKQTKHMFTNDYSYQVGYIMSNIDTLEINLRNMKKDMERNKYVWDDGKILNLYDTVQVSNRAVSDLMELLKIYVEKTLN